MTENVDEQLIMARTGHRSVDAVREYKRPDSMVQRKISDILQPPRPKVRATTATATVSVPPADDCVSQVESVVTSSSVVSKCSAGTTEVATKVKETSAKVVCQTECRDTIIKIKKGEQEVEIVLK